ncbi:1-phosphatidylinositol-4-phosphate 5-kinase [Bertholletia excelsa]
MMLFLDEFCCRADVIDKTYHVNKKARGTVEIVDDAYCVSVPSAVKLLVLQSQHQHKTKEDSEKPNVLEVVICRRHMNYEALFWAICVGLPKRELSPLDFNYSQGTQIQYSTWNPTSSPPGTVNNFQWKDYCPAVFRHLQELGNIDYADCMLSVCGHKTLREVSSPGKSGSLLFRSMDDRFVIKTLRQAEVKVLIEMLPNYLHHVKYGSSLLVKLYGLHSVRPVGGLKVYFVVMENVLQSDLFLHRRSDLKGSSQVYQTTWFYMKEAEILREKFKIFNFFIILQIRYDCKFLEAQGIMDYSFLLGIYLEAPIKEDSFGNSSQGSHSPNRTDAVLGVEVPALAVKLPRTKRDGMSLQREVSGGECYNALLYFGIIDILQGYSVKKRLEHAYKSIQYDPESISAEFLCKVFQAEELDL